MELSEILIELEKLGKPEVKSIKERFAITAENSDGIFLKDLEALAKKIGKNDDLTLRLFDTGLYEARILCSKLFNPRHITEPMMEKWVKTFLNWEQVSDT